MKNKNILDSWTIVLVLILIGLTAGIFGMLYWKEKNIKINFETFDQSKEIKKASEMIKNDKILISFSGPVQQESLGGVLNIEPSLDFDYIFLNNHQIQVELKDNLKPEIEYRFKLNNFRGKWGLENQGDSIKFSTKKPPNFKSLYPFHEQENVEIDDELVFEFDRDFNGLYYLELNSEPHFEFEQLKGDDKGKFRIRPLKPLDYNTEYNLTVEIKSVFFVDYNKEIVKTKFKTKVPPVVVYGWNSKGEFTRTENRTKTEKSKINSGRYIDINLSEQNMYIFEDSKELGAYKISSGIRGMDTPIGQFEVMGRSSRPWSKKYKLYMPWFIQFTGEGHGIHELPEWPGGYKEGTNHLGIPVSHGCVRLGVGPAKVVYDFVEAGTPIVIHY